MNWYRKAKEEQSNQTTLFRGDENPIDISDFDHDYAVKTLGKELSSSKSNGPGIYFTVSEENAGFYGSNITKRTLQNANILTESTPKLNYRQIEKIFKGVGQERMETAISNWHENYNIGRRMLIQNILEANDPIDQLMVIWADVFYHQNPHEFIQLMVNNGIDGISVVIQNASDPNNNDTHYIIYNTNVLV